MVKNFQQALYCKIKVVTSTVQLDGTAHYKRECERENQVLRTAVVPITFAEAEPSLSMRHGNGAFVYVMIQEEFNPPV